MTLELKINGYFDFTVCTLGTEKPVDNETAKGALCNLQQGEYVIDIRNRTISDINDLQNPVYSFVLEAISNNVYRRWILV
jgi:hypothetical protein